jgi:hypothetical protein
MPLELVPAWATRSDVWSKYTTSDALFRDLLVDDGRSWSKTSWFVDSAATDTLPGVVLWWKEGHLKHLESAQQPDALRRWKLFGQILWCFEEARALEDSPEDIDYSTLATRLPEFDAGGIHQYAGDPANQSRSEDVARAYMCIRSFQMAQPLRTVEVPVALFDLSDNRGFIATLTLDLMPGGRGEIAPHLGSAFETIYHSAFETSIRRAWNMAGGRNEGRTDGRWRLRRGGPLDMSQRRRITLDAVDGPSAGGAAARGWWHLLHGKEPDAEIVVMAQILSDESSLESVAHLRDKVLAVVDEGKGPDGGLVYDTIVVVGDAARVTAQEALGSCRQIRVVSLA